ncbi:MAG: hypothetical protein ACXWWJ_09155 [Nitrospira sp.]
MPDAERCSGSAVQETFNLCYDRRMICREVDPLLEDVPNEAVRVLIHTTFPCMIGRGKAGLNVQDAGELSVSGKFLAVVVVDGPNVNAQRFQALPRWRDRMGQRRDGGEHSFALDMDEPYRVVPL